MAPRITSDHVSWTQLSKDADGPHYSAGVLHLHSNGVEGHGVVAIGTSHRDAVRHDVLATAVPSVAYQTQLTSARYPSGTDPNTVPASGWQPGLSLEIGYQQQIGDSLPTPVVTLDGQDISQQCAWSVNDRFTVLNIALSDSDCEFRADAVRAGDAVVRRADVERTGCRHGTAQFFNETPPVISDHDQEGLVKQSLDWYQHQFAMAYLTQSFNNYTGPNQPDTRLSCGRIPSLARSPASRKANGPISALISSRWCRFSGEGPGTTSARFFGALAPADERPIGAPEHVVVHK